MMNRKSKKRRLYLCWLAAAVLVVVFTAPAFAQEEPNDPVLPDPNMPEGPRLPGTVEGTGTYFEVTDSNYLNITFESSEPVHLRLESVPEMVVMDINSAEGATSIQITLTGFEASTTYYKYEDDYHNGVAFTTGDNGTYTFAQDLSQPHLVFIQMNPGTIYIPSDTSVGIWDTVTRTYTLTTDVYDTIQIDEDNLTLDGDGHTLTGTSSGYGVFLYRRTGVTIKNVNVQRLHYGIYLQRSSNNTLTENTASNNLFAIELLYSNRNILTGNTGSNNSYGIYLRDSSGNTLTDNTTSDSISGIYLSWSTGTTLTGNTASNNGYGIYLSWSAGTTLTGNTVSSTSHDGICLSYSNNNTLTDNTANWNIDESGIELYRSNGNTLTGNRASNNSLGISLYESSNNILTANTTSYNGQGYAIRFASYNTLAGNTASNNSAGFELDNSNNNTLTDNTADGTYEEAAIELF